MKRIIFILFMVFLSAPAPGQMANSLEVQYNYLDGEMTADVYRAYYVQEFPKSRLVMRIGPSLFREWSENPKNFWGIVGGIGGVWRKRAIMVQAGALAGIDKNCWQYGPFAAVGIGWGNVDIKIESSGGFFWDDGPMTFWTVGVGVNYLVKISRL